MERGKGNSNPYIKEAQKTQLRTSRDIGATDEEVARERGTDEG